MAQGNKHHENLKKIERAFFVVAYSKPWEELNIHPKDFKLTYWTNDEITDISNEM